MRHCAAGDWDRCLNGRYTERGIKAAHGFLAQRHVEDSAYLVPVPASLEPVAVLLEPLSVVEKAIEQIHRIQVWMAWQPGKALVLGAGSIGTLATLLLRLEEMQVHLYSKGGVVPAAPPSGSNER